MQNPVYKVIASSLAAMQNCEKSGNAEWRDRHESRLETLMKETAPSGSGFDSGTTLDLDASNPEKLVFDTSFHHMNENGMYDGWTEHKVTAKPSLLHRFTLTVSGRNRNGIKDYIAETFDHWLKSDFRTWTAEE